MDDGHRRETADRLEAAPITLKAFKKTQGSHKRGVPGLSYPRMLEIVADGSS